MRSSLRWTAGRKVGHRHSASRAARSRGLAWRHMLRSRVHASAVPTGGPAAIRYKREGLRMGILRGLVGLLGLVAIAWALSEDRRHVPWRVVGAGILLQIGLALLIKLPLVASAFLLLNDGVGALQKATDTGTAFVFGYLAGAPNHLPKPIRMRISSSPFGPFHWCW